MQLALLVSLVDGSLELLHELVFETPLLTVDDEIIGSLIGDKHADDAALSHGIQIAGGFGGEQRCDTLQIRGESLLRREREPHERPQQEKAQRRDGAREKAEALGDHACRYPRRGSR